MKIRDEIAQEKLQAQLAKVQALLAKYRQEWVDYDADAKNNPGAKEPTPPDFGALAIKYNMTAGRTGLLSQSRPRGRPTWANRSTCSSELPVAQIDVSGRRPSTSPTFPTIQSFRVTDLLRLLEDR